MKGRTMNDVVVDKILRVIKNKNKNVYDDGELTYTYGEIDVFFRYNLAIY